MSDSFRPQAEPRPLYELDVDHLRGLKQTSDNNQPLMALQYAHKLIERLVREVQDLRAEVEGLKVAAHPAESRSSRRKAEESSSEA